MQSTHRPAPGVRDTWSPSPSPSDKLSSPLRGSDSPNCLNHKELPFDRVGIAHALPKHRADSRKATKPMNGLDDKAKMTAPMAQPLTSSFNSTRCPLMCIIRRYRTRAEC